MDYLKKIITKGENNMKSKRRIVSALLCIMLTINLVITDVVAYASGNNRSYMNEQVDNINENVATDLGEIDIEANNSLGTLFESELSDVTSEQEATDGYNVFSVEMIDTVAVVDFETLQDCKLIVGIYNEDNDKLLMSGTLDVYAGEIQAYVDIDTDAMPDYYYIRAYLVAYDTLQPLSNEYESSMYTKEMQEFLAKTTDDFNQELVLNFDDDKTNNFAVYAENTKRIEKTSDDVNQVTGIDEENNTYVIENADDEILSLVAGDVFAYEYTDDETDVLIVKVKSISVDGTTVTIVGEETTIEEVFDYFRIDEGAGTDEFVVEEGTCDEGIVYNGMVEVTDDVQTYAKDYEGSKEFSSSYDFPNCEIKDSSGNFSVKLDGSINYGVKLSVKVYISKNDKYVELKAEANADFELSLSGKVKSNGISLNNMDCKIGSFDVISIKIKPRLVLSAEIKGKIKGSITGMVGARISTKTGFESLNSTPVLEFDAGVEGTVYVGIEAGPEVEILDDKIFTAKITGNFGVEAKAAFNIVNASTKSEDKKHACSNCVDGEFVAKAGIKIVFKSKKIDELNIDKDFSKDFKICDWYWSIDKGDFSIGECPYLSYKITFSVVDKSTNKPIIGVNVNDGKNGKNTNKYGLASLYLEPGDHVIQAYKNGYVLYLEDIHVGNAAKRDVFRLEKNDSSTGSGGTTEEGGGTTEEGGGTTEEGGNKTDEIKIDSTSFPDDIFRQYIIENIDDGDGVLSNEERLSVTSIEIEEMEISNLSGIEYFSGIKKLICYDNNISSLDLSNNTELELLDCDNNNLSELDLSKCNKLTTLYCDNNYINTLNISNCPELLYLWCENNNLSQLDLSNCSKIIDIQADENNLDTLDLSLCHNLEKLDVYYNKLYTLDMSNCKKIAYIRAERNSLNSIALNNCTELEELLLYSNDLSSININDCTKLVELDIMNNNLTTIDVSKCTELEYLTVSFNELGALDVSNCSKLTKLIANFNNILTLDLSNNPNLFDLQCDKDVQVIYASSSSLNTSCNTNGESSTDKSYDSASTGISNDRYNNVNTGIFTDINNISLNNASTLASNVNSDLIQRVTTADDNTIEYTGLLANTDYNLYVLKESSEKIPFSGELTPDNILYIRQYTTDANGALTIGYNPTEEVSGAKEILVCKDRIDISKSSELTVLDVEYSGEENTPIIQLKVNGVILNEGEDYEVIGNCNVTNEGEYTITVSGIGIYCGSIEETFNVNKVQVEKVSISKSSITLNEGDTTTLTTTVLPDNASNKTIAWTSNNTSVATVDSNGKITAIKAGNATITATAADGSGISASCTITVKAKTSDEQKPDTPKYYPTINTSYRTHIQSFGWEGDASDIKTWKSNGTMSGTSGKAKRLEGINIVVNSAEAGKHIDLGIQYTTHCQSYGWLPWSADGDMNGTEGEAKRLEAIKIQLTGADKDAYDVYYRVHAQSYGWLNWAKNGAPSGTAGYGKRLEGIQIVVVKKGESFNQKMEGITSVRTESYIAKEGSSPIVNYAPTSNTNPVIPGADTPNVAYRTHVQSFGWQGWKYNGQMSGTSGLAKRLEGININLTNKPYEGDIVYTTHIQKYGWKDGKPEDTTRASWKKNGAMSGTSGEAKRLEAICIDLTGEMAEHYDIYYRVHAQSFGWLGWAKNGDESGTAGYAKRLEGIQIVLVPKGGAAPANNYGGVTSARTEAYIEK